MVRVKEKKSKVSTHLVLVIRDPTRSMRPPLLRVLCGVLLCALVLALVARVVVPFAESFQTRPPDPLQAGHEWAASDVDPVAAAGEHGILLTNVGQRGEFNIHESDGVRRGEFTTDTDTAQPMGSFTAQLPSRPPGLALRAHRPLDWHCQRPWMQCCGPSYLEAPVPCVEEEAPLPRR